MSTTPCLRNGVGFMVAAFLVVAAENRADAHHWAKSYFSVVNSKTGDVNTAPRVYYVRKTSASTNVVTHHGHYDNSNKFRRSRPPWASTIHRRGLSVRNRNGGIR
jgi:hypothetical protein